MRWVQEAQDRDRGSSVSIPPSSCLTCTVLTLTLGRRSPWRALPLARPLKMWATSSWISNWTQWVRVVENGSRSRVYQAFLTFRGFASTSRRLRVLIRPLSLKFLISETKSHQVHKWVHTSWWCICVWVRVFVRLETFIRGHDWCRSTSSRLSW